MVWWGDLLLVFGVLATGFWLGKSRPGKKDEMDLLLVVRDQAEGIEGLIREICNWSRGDVWVVDDGSGDTTLEIIERLARELPFRYISHPGQGAVDAGMRACARSLVMVVKADGCQQGNGSIPLLAGSIQRLAGTFRQSAKK